MARTITVITAPQTPTTPGGLTGGAAVVSVRVVGPNPVGFGLGPGVTVTPGDANPRVIPAESSVRVRAAGGISLWAPSGPTSVEIDNNPTSSAAPLIES